MANHKKLPAPTSSLPNGGRDSMGRALNKIGRQIVSYNIEEPDPVTGQKRWVQKRAKREVIAAQSIWALAMKGNLSAYRLVYDILNGPAEQRVKIDAQFTHEASQLPLEMDPDARQKAFADLMASAKKRQEAAMKNVTPPPEPPVIAPAQPVDGDAEE